jgi:1-deoxy-D-xylulose-5-phosphate synthase
VPIGKAEVKLRGKRIALLAFGSMVAPAVAAGTALNATVVNMRFVKPLDAALLAELATSHDAFVTIEEHVAMGGAGSACAEALAQAGVSKPILHLGLPDRFIDHGDHALLLKLQGLDAAGIEASVRLRFAELLAADSPTRLVASR